MHELKHSKRQGVILKIDFEKAYEKVKWNFVHEVLERKELPDLWIKWVMQSVQGGQVCINVNGHRSSYFKTYQGLRQGDPLSPLLFNLVADVLGELVDKTVDKGLITGVVNHLLPKRYLTSSMLMILL